MRPMHMLCAILAVVLSISGIQCSDVVLLEIGESMTVPSQIVLLGQKKILKNTTLPLSSRSLNERSDVCNLAFHEYLSPLEANPECYALLHLLHSSNYSTSCIHSCFDTYMNSYNRLNELDCIGKHAQSADEVREFICTSQPVEFDCGGFGSHLMDRLSSNETCAPFLDALVSGRLRGFCEDSCFSRYMHGYQRLWNESCLIDDLSAVAPGKFYDSICNQNIANANEAATEVNEGSTGETLAGGQDRNTSSGNSSARSPTPGPTPATTATHTSAPTPMPTFDTHCEALAHEKLSPLSGTVCAILLQGHNTISHSHHIPEVCLSACFQNYMAAYTDLLNAQCVFGTGDLSPSIHSAALCSGSRTNVTLGAPLTSEISCTLSLPLSTITPQAFRALHSSDFVAAISATIAVDPSKIDILRVFRGSIVVEFTIATTLESALIVQNTLSMAARDATLTTNLNSAFHARGSALRVDSVSILSLNATMVQDCEHLNSVFRSTCQQSALCLPTVPSQGCCSSVLNLMISTCETDALGCGTSFPNYFTNQCRENPVPGPAGSGGASIGNTTGPGMDEHGCLTTQNYTWCAASEMCVQDYQGGHLGPCPPPVQSPNCAMECIHGVCVDAGYCRCDIGFAGRDCGITCPQQCNTRGTCLLDGTCDCEEGYQGVACEFTIGENMPGQPTNDCGGDFFMCNAKGACLNHECECHYGYEGENCSHHIFANCPHQCSGHGANCVGGRCICSRGYEGVDCRRVATCREYSFCTGHGICNEDTHHCECGNGWHGIDCSQMVMCNSSCSARGTCSGAYPNQACVCDERFDGASCDHLVSTICPGGCSSHGSCDEASGRCSCNRGWSGADCALFEQPSVCKRCQHGSCVHGTQSNNPYCECQTGWNGTYCDQVIACNHLSFCSGRGTCERNACVCFEGFQGAECAEAKAQCGPDCGEHGHCHVSYTFNMTSGEIEPMQTCVCDFGYSGENCQTVDCPTDDEGNVCANNGVCEAKHFFGGDRAFCTCDNGYFGIECGEQEQGCPGPRPCHGHGLCVDGACDCEHGWDGADCSVEIHVPAPKSAIDGAGTEECCPSGCQSNGVCQEDCSCVCNPGWEGDDCSAYKDI